MRRANELNLALDKLHRSYRDFRNREAEAKGFFMLNVMQTAVTATSGIVRRGKVRKSMNSWLYRSYRDFRNREAV